MTTVVTSILLSLGAAAAAAADAPVEIKAPAEAAYPVAEIVRRNAVDFIDGKSHLAIVVGVTEHGRRRVWGFGGYPRNGERVVPDGRTMYEIGSITKTLTGTLLADLARDGTVQVDDPVACHLPDDWTMPRRDGRDVSLLHLATHTSSLPRLPPGFDTHVLLTLSVNDPYSQYTADDLKSTLSKLKLTRTIGSRHAYSNLGMGLLGVALAHAANDGDVDRLFQERLLTPLSLTDTTFTLNDEQRTRMAPPFDSLGFPASRWHFDCLKACGGLRSTTNDMLAYAEAAMGQTETPLKPAFAAAMQPWREIPGDNRSIGLGWFVRPLSMPDGVSSSPESHLVWHNGATGGYQTFLGLIPERRCGIVVLSNSTASVDPDLTWPVIRALLREEETSRPR